MADSMRRSRMGGRALATLGVTLAALALTALVMAPLRHAGLHTDDWAWLALATQADSPWPAYAQGLMFGYFYRPTAFVSWFVAERAFGDSALPHYALSLATHALSAAALGAWLRAAGLRTPATAVAFALFALAPATTGLVLWASNRNEALTVLFGLLALRAACANGRWTHVATFALLALSISAKETGLLFAMAVAVQGLLRPGDAWRARASTLVAPLLAVALVFGVRQTVVLPIDPAAGGDTPLLALLATGGAAWWANLPRVVAGVHGAVPVALVVSVLALVLATAGWRARAPTLRPVAAVGALLLLLPALVQSPITALVLGDPSAPMALVNLRFYAIATLGFAVLAGCAWPQSGTAPRVAAVAVLLGVLGAWAATSHRNAEQWAAETRTMRFDAPAVAASLVSRAPPPSAPCLVDVRGVPLPPGVRPYFDAMLRPHWPDGEPLARCVFAADGALPYVSFLPAGACAVTDWSALGIEVATLHGEPYVATLAGACQIILRPAAGGLRPSRVIDWSALLTGSAADGGGGAILRANEHP